MELHNVGGKIGDNERNWSRHVLHHLEGKTFKTFKALQDEVINKLNEEKKRLANHQARSSDDL